MSTVDQIIDVETLWFFEKNPAALPIYECLLSGFTNDSLTQNEEYRRHRSHSLTVTSLPAYHSKG